MKQITPIVARFEIGAKKASKWIACLCATAAPTMIVHAQSLDIDALIMKTIGDLASEVPSFLDAESVLQSGISGNQPSGTVSFAQLADKAHKLEDDIRNPPPPPWTGWSSTYTVSLDDLRNCQTHPAAMGRLAASSSNLEKAIKDGQTKLARIEDGLKQAQASLDAAKFLDQNLQKVIYLPWYGSIFIGDMIDVNTKVIPALGGVVTALANYRTQFNASLDQAKAQSGNLQANLAQMQNWDPMAGTWHWSGAGGGTNFGGGNYYQYHVDFNGPGAQLVIDNSRRVVGGAVSGTMIERVLNGHVGVIPANTHQFGFSGGSVSGAAVNANFIGNPANAPKTAAAFTGGVAANCSTITGTLRVWRTDVGAPLNWSVAMPVTLVR